MQPSINISRRSLKAGCTTTVLKETHKIVGVFLRWKEISFPFMIIFPEELFFLSLSKASSQKSVMRCFLSLLPSSLWMHDTNELLRWKKSFDDTKRVRGDVMGCSVKEKCEKTQTRFFFLQTFSWSTRENVFEFLIFHLDYVDTLFKC